MAILDVSQVTVYQGVDRPVRALDDIGLHIDGGEPVSIIGPSGCGKSTLLLVAAGLMLPTSGQVKVDEAPVRGPRIRTALILQDFGLLPWKTVFANAALGLQIRNVGAQQVKASTLGALETVGLTDFAAAYPGELSGGMRQRLALARALALEADLMLMDEPLSALDELTREVLQELLLDLWRRRGHTQLMVTHSVEEAVYLGRRIVVLSPRPGKVASVVDNPGVGSHDFRASEAFHSNCARLRLMLREQGAFADNHIGAGGDAS